MNTKEDQSSVSVSPDSSTNAEVNIRRLSTLEEYEECVKLQKEIWGSDFKECVSVPVLNISQKIGGLVAGAFQGERLLGLCTA
jgi:predicted GNAT superfamily acetyltransferase